MKSFIFAFAAAGLTLSGCSSVGGEGYGFGGYSLIRARSVAVGDGSMAVTPPRECAQPCSRFNWPVLPPL